MSTEPWVRRPVRRVEGRHVVDAEDGVAEETAIALLYNGRPHAVMMATPDDLEDFALGFTITEGIVARATDVELVDCVAGARGISLQLLIPQACFDALASRQKQLTGRTGCGLCGAATLDAAVRPVRRLAAADAIPRRSLRAALQGLQTQQPLNRETGALHAAAVLCTDGTLLVREDIGRHNAIDKAVGAAARANLEGSILAVTSRASYEVVHKAAESGCRLVVAISAPTAYAIRLAEEAGVTLVGFARGERLTIYARPQGLEL